MIRLRSVICQDCGHRATVQEGGGTGYYLLHCQDCGQAKTVETAQVETAHLLYLKGLPESGRQLSQDYDAAMKQRIEATPGAPLDLEEYLAAVEEAAGRCSCGGEFALDAPPRCPACHSPRLADDPDRGTLYVRR